MSKEEIPDIFLPLNRKPVRLHILLRLSKHISYYVPFCLRGTTHLTGGMIDYIKSKFM